jgi:hypothetical protein
MSRGSGAGEGWIRVVKIGFRGRLGLNAHGLSMRRKGLIIGKPGETGTGDFGTGNERLAGAARIYFGGEGLTGVWEGPKSGSWREVSAKDLPAYLEETTFRFNRSGCSDQFVDTLRHMVTADALTFQELTAE